MKPISMRDLQRWGGVIAFAAGLPLSAPSAVAQFVLYESATLGETNQEVGLAVFGFQFVGARFHLDQPAAIAGVGGHIMGIGRSSFFAAFVSLSSPQGLPAGSPLTSSEVLAYTTCVTDPGPISSRDYFFDLPINLGAGDYGLVFGAGLFGVPAGPGVALPGDNGPVPGASFFIWDTQEWRSYDNVGYRFVVYAVPEPSGFALLGLPLGCLFLFRKASRRLRPN